jgi:SAM-dependent methyltransferase
MGAAASWIKSSLPAPLIEWLLRLRHWRRPLPNRRLYEGYVRGKAGLEIGGPSPLFSIVLPLYPQARSVDGVNFSASTVWEGSLTPGRTFRYYRHRLGMQYLCEATDLAPIAASAYEFVLSSNCLEHVANPIKALLEWKRVLRGGGALVLVVPNKASNFDHRRPFTSFEHLLEDYERGTTEDDLTHLEEILALHDLSRDPPAGSLETFKARSLENFTNRTLHHHVFEPETVARMLRYAGFEVIATSETRTDFFTLAVKG